MSTINGVAYSKKIAILMKKEQNKSVIRFSMPSRLQIGKILENAGILK